MEIIQAMRTRISCRAFTDRLVEDDLFAELEAEIERMNAESGLSFQLYGPREDGTALDMMPAMFASNPPCYAALVSKAGPEPEERLGYYGELLALKAEQLGLSTCWVASTYRKSTARVELAEGEKLHDVIAIGYAPLKMPLTQRSIRAALRSRDKSIDKFWMGPTPLEEAPEWLRACIGAVRMGPSGVNAQPVVFVQELEGGPIRAELSQLRHRTEYVDLGIAKLHFELMAAHQGMPGHWEWGVGGAFIFDEEEKASL